jgi:hypothetical protein
VAAWEESDSTAVADARLLLNLRLPSPTRTTRIRLAYLAGASWQELAGPVAESLPSEARRSFGQAQVGFDAGGRLYLLFRARTAAMTGRTDWASTDRWETFVTRRAGDDWLPAVVMPSSAGRSTMRAHLTFASGKVMIVWPTDQREWPGAAYAPSEVRGAAIPVEGAPTVFSKVQ